MMRARASAVAQATWGVRKQRGAASRGLLVIVMALLVLDRRALLGVDWGLLVTFAAFFTLSNATCPER